MILRSYLAEPSTMVTITFIGDGPASIQGSIAKFDEHHIILMSGGVEHFIPWTAVAMVTNHFKK